MPAYAMASAGFASADLPVASSDDYETVHPSHRYMYDYDTQRSAEPSAAENGGTYSAAHCSAHLTEKSATQSTMEVGSPPERPEPRLPDSDGGRGFSPEASSGRRRASQRFRPPGPRSEAPLAQSLAEDTNGPHDVESVQWEGVPETPAFEPPLVPPLPQVVQAPPPPPPRRSFDSRPPGYLQHQGSTTWDVSPDHDQGAAQQSQWGHQQQAEGRAWGSTLPPPSHVTLRPSVGSVTSEQQWTASQAQGVSSTDQVVLPRQPSGEQWPQQSAHAMSDHWTTPQTQPQQASWATEQSQAQPPAEQWSQHAQQHPSGDQWASTQQPHSSEQWSSQHSHVSDNWSSASQQTPGQPSANGDPWAPQPSQTIQQNDSWNSHQTTSGTPTYAQSNTLSSDQWRPHHESQAPAKSDKWASSLAHNQWNSNSHPNLASQQTPSNPTWDPNSQGPAHGSDQGQHQQAAAAAAAAAVAQLQSQYATRQSSQQQYSYMEYTAGANDHPTQVSVSQGPATPSPLSPPPGAAAPPSGLDIMQALQHQLGPNGDIAAAYAQTVALMQQQQQLMQASNSAKSNDSIGGAASSSWANSAAAAAAAAATGVMQPNMPPVYSQSLVDPVKVQAIYELLQQQQQQQGGSSIPVGAEDSSVSAQRQYSGVQQAVVVEHSQQGHYGISQLGGSNPNLSHLVPTGPSSTTEHGMPFTTQPLPAQHAVSTQENFSYQPLPTQQVPVASAEIAAATAFAQGSPAAFLLQQATSGQHQLQHPPGLSPLARQQTLPQPAVPAPANPSAAPQPVAPAAPDSSGVDLSQYMSLSQAEKLKKEVSRLQGEVDRLEKEVGRQKSLRETERAEFSEAKDRLKSSWAADREDFARVKDSLKKKNAEHHIQSGKLSQAVREAESVSRSLRELCAREGVDIPPNLDGPGYSSGLKERLTERGRGEIERSASGELSDSAEETLPKSSVHFEGEDARTTSRSVAGDDTPSQTPSAGHSRKSFSEISRELADHKAVASVKATADSSALISPNDTIPNETAEAAAGAAAIAEQLATALGQLSAALTSTAHAAADDAADTAAGKEGQHQDDSQPVANGAPSLEAIDPNLVVSAVTQAFAQLASSVAQADAQASAAGPSQPIASPTGKIASVVAAVSDAVTPSGAPGNDEAGIKAEEE